MSAPERHQTSPGRQDAGLWATLAKTHAAGTLLPAHQHRSGQLAFATRGVMLVEAPHARWTVPPQGERAFGDREGKTAVSDRSFTRRFTAEAGLSFRAWRQRARIIASLDLLASGRPVKGIAHALQFESPAAYIASFRTLLGCTPNTFRQGQHGDTHP